MLKIDSFADFNLSKKLLSALSALGYEAPTPVQAQTIPLILEGRDLIAQAQTGTGKTAAFALPLLEKLNLKERDPQVLVLAPTRELAIQVAEAFQSYAKHLEGFHVLPIYGGQGYPQQLRALERGAHVIVGTPGRVMDHIGRKTLNLNNIKTLVLDEADEMLRMGFLEDIKWVLERMPPEHQTVLFSATMPTTIQHVASKYLNNPRHIKIESKTMTASGVTQSVMLVSLKNKLEALTRYLEAEDFDGIIIFARTKNMTTDLAQKLSARGYLTAALNGDMNQSAREKVIQRVKKKSLDIIVATDVAARGLDIKRLSHVINYDVPHDIETYVHRIGRTGRAGLEGKSLLLITPREQRFCRDIERTTNQPVQVITPPTIEELSAARIENFATKILQIIESGDLDDYREMVQKMANQSESSELDIAAALLKLAQKNKPLLMKGQDAPLLDPSDNEAPSHQGRQRPRRAGQRTQGNRGKPASAGGRRGKPASAGGDRGKPAFAGGGRRKPDGERRRKPSEGGFASAKPKSKSKPQSGSKSKPRRSSGSPVSQSNSRRPKRK